MFTFITESKGNIGQTLTHREPTSLFKIEQSGATNTMVSTDMLEQTSDMVCTLF